MAATLLDGRLHEVRIIGQNLSGTLKDSCISASLSLSRSQVTEMSMTFADNMNADLWRYGLLAPGTDIDYGPWRLRIDDVNFGPGALGPAVTIKAPSRYVAALKSQRGAYAWGVRDVSQWFREMADAVGFKTVVQPGLGEQDIIRDGGTGEGPPPTSWDVMSNVARTANVWMFEVGDTFYAASPEWLRNNATRKIELYFNNWFDYSPNLAGPPQYHGSGSGEAETLQLGLIAPDADTVVTGDILSISGSGCGDMGGTWIVESVSYPMTVAGPVSVSCRRVGSPPPGISSLSHDTTAILGIGEVNWAPGNFTAASFSPNVDWPVFYTPGTAYNIIMSAFKNTKEQAAGAVGVASVDAFVRKYNGQAVDYDGAFGAQCVDLTAFYFKEVVGVTPARGNGKDIFYNQNDGVSKVGAGSPAKPGDVACWGSALGGGYGHVAIVLADQGGSLLCLSQNPGPAHQMVISKSGLIGYCRPTRAL